jgi:putative ABC transport system permease protein
LTKVAIRGLLARKVRAGLTAVAILLGVMMIAGTYVLTDTINSSFDKIFEQASKGIDVKVTPHETVDLQDAEPPPMSEELLTKVRAVEGVDDAAGGVFNNVAILGDDGKSVAHGGAPSFAASVVPEKFDPFQYPEGRRPRVNGEVVVDKFTAEREHFKVGESIRIAGQDSTERFKVVGIAKFGDVESFGGASFAVLTLQDAQRLTGNVGKLDEIDVAAAPGVSPAELSKRVRAVLPASAVDVRTGSEQAAKDSKDSRDDLSFLRTALLAFALISVFVVSFIFFNTF